MRGFAIAVLATGCYSARAAAPDINDAWRGRGRLELEARIGPATQEGKQPDGNIALKWIGHGTNIVSLPSGHLDLKISPTSFSIDAAANPGVVERTTYTRALAIVAPGGAVLEFDGAFAAGFPDGLNVRTGLVMGLTAAAGAFSNATTPMPSLGLYIGGMIGPRLALIGSYQFVNAKGEDDYAMGHVWGFGVQHWPAARLAVRALGVAGVDIEPNEDASFGPGATAGVGYALVRSGSFVLDVRVDGIFTTQAAFGLAGIGVNVN